MESEGTMVVKSDTDNTLKLLAAAILPFYDDSFEPKSREDVADILRCIKDHGYLIIERKEE